ncbi:IstB-like ATP-binding protein [Pseudomonas savastanoi pv. savastanoi]|uniref:IstB-like ATP-binding protein n=2 Tax=Pseudomonas syringae group TaxID=136849 RepID=A0A108WKC9_PSEA0|nr:IstB-like ATP-binding protein [Pseudomonas syringae pv. castaneae]KWS42214.1 ATP-binding protein [Pseudomonas savastanoi pv. nerii]KWS67576.1 ATP-binding protein [Pseudomonas amygdali pv. morsprunorum]KWS72480.1 ATP-binding protein [Pseudomonas amygdali pv. eriobotryae]PHN49143.1 ATP-binding protein [Pseudomonas amygdali]RMN67509.1 IstB-like ATP-binding protein [Pseudomonas savastanoi pv. savastanoi]RMR75245.1 IstB-like ATP-binding protein [Pseudomonas savastanoi pv. fraxini]
MILDELGYLPLCQSGGALLFHLLSKLCEHTSVVITTMDSVRQAVPAVMAFRYGLKAIQTRE